MTQPPAYPSRTFRLTCLPRERPQVEALLEAEGFRFEPLPFYEAARVATREPFPLGSSLAAAFGLIYIQDRSSMLPPLALHPRPGDTVLDLCASPGGKTGILAGLVGPRGCVLANEPNHRRWLTLRRNLLLTNVMNVVTSQYPGDRFPETEHSFSHILADVPCSAWGTAAKNPQVTRLWREETIAPLLALQRRILTRSAQLLAPGGRLLYSTCTTNARENEDQIHWARLHLGLEPFELPVFPDFVLETPLQGNLHGCVRIHGEASRGHSFFLAGLTKPGSAELPEMPPHPDRSTSLDLQTLFEHPIETAAIPRGQVCIRNHRLEFRPETALRRLPASIRWQGVYLGKHTKQILVSARARSLVPPVGQGPELHFTSIEKLRQLLTGQSIELAAAPGQRCLGLYFRELPLGWLTCKGRRCFWTDKN